MLVYWPATGVDKDQGSGTAILSWSMLCNDLFAACTVWLWSFFSFGTWDIAGPKLCLTSSLLREVRRRLTRSPSVRINLSCAASLARDLLERRIEGLEPDIVYEQKSLRC